jgi:hypothetical protein
LTKKILFISKYLSTHKNGFESRLSTIIRYFKKYNHQVCAITSSSILAKKKIKKNYIYKKIDKVDYYFLKDKQKYSSYSFERVISWINFEFRVFTFNYDLIRFKPEIIYISSLSLLTILNGIYLKKKFNAKLIFEMRDIIPFGLYNTGKLSKFNPAIIILGVIEKLGIHQSDLIISLIPKIKEYLLYRGFKNKKNFASTFPVNKKFFIKKKFNFSLDKKKFNICYAGNFGFDNYLEDLLDLISNIKNKSFIFHFFGKGSQKDILEKKFKNLSNVKFYKHIDYKNLHSILIQMDCLTISFGFNEKYPLFGYELNKLNNYLMASKPVLITGKKENLLNNRGKFTFVTKKDPILFEKKLLLIKKNYQSFLKIAKLNKRKLLIRNDPKLIFNATEKQLNNV